MCVCFALILVSSHVQAQRADIRCIILPEENRRDVEDLDDFIKKEVQFHFVKHYSEVYEIIFDTA